MTMINDVSKKIKKGYWRESEFGFELFLKKCNAFCVRINDVDGFFQEFLQVFIINLEQLVHKGASFKCFF